MSAEGAEKGKSAGMPFEYGSGKGDPTRLARPIVPSYGPKGVRPNLRIRKGITALLVGSFVVGVYLYSFHAISQETFLDDLEVEAKALRAKAAQNSGTD